eukprot:scaffold308646_cov26-Tisochrysis_lutea.AAC.1
MGFIAHQSACRALHTMGIQAHQSAYRTLHTVRIKAYQSACRDLHTMGSQVHKSACHTPRTVHQVPSSKSLRQYAAHYSLCTINIVHPSRSPGMKCTWHYVTHAHHSACRALCIVHSHHHHHHHHHSLITALCTIHTCTMCVKQITHSATHCLLPLPARANSNCTDFCPRNCSSLSFPLAMEGLQAEGYEKAPSETPTGMLIHYLAGTSSLAKGVYFNLVVQHLLHACVQYQKVDISYVQRIIAFAYTYIVKRTTKGGGFHMCGACSHVHTCVVKSRRGRASQDAGQSARVLPGHPLQLHE